MKKYLIIIGIIIVLIFVKMKFFSPDKPKAAKGKEGNKSSASLVTVYVVNDKKLEEKIEANGTVLANEEAELKLESSGRITFLNLPEGRQVQKGTLLLKLNDAEYTTQLEKLIVKLKLAYLTESRLKKLVENDGISKQEYDIANSDLYSLKADSAYLKTQILKTSLYAPFTGVIGIRNVSMGSYITPLTAVAVIHQINPVKIEFSLPEKYSDLFAVGDEIAFYKEGLEKPLKARISVIDPAIDLTNRSLRLRAVADNSQKLLFPGAFVRVELNVKGKNNTLFVPTEAIVPVAKGKKVFVVKNNIALEKYIETGVRTEDFVQIFGNVQVGDSVVLNGNYQLKDSTKVKVKKR